MANHIDILSCLKGKTIENVAAKLTETGAREITFFLENGQFVNFYSSITFHGNDEHVADSEISVEIG